MNNTPNWRVFPQFEKTFAQNDSTAVLSQIEATCRRLDEVNRTGSTTMQLRARVALAGYVRLLELIRLINEQRQPAKAV